jgi:CRISPR-associated endonuclease Cas1
LRYPDQGVHVRRVAILLQNAESLLTSTTDKRHLFLLEARATRTYWRAFRHLSRAPNGWTRIHPHASDPWNIALNIGYTLLTNKIRHALIAVGLDPEIGFLHASHHGKDALVYDVMEIFRTSMVDVAVIRLFSRISDQKAVEPQRVIREITIRGSLLCAYDGRVSRVK